MPPQQLVSCSKPEEMPVQIGLWVEARADEETSEAAAAAGGGCR